MSERPGEAGRAGHRSGSGVMERIQRFLRELRARHRSYGVVLTVHSALFRRLERWGFHLFLVEVGADSPGIEAPVLPAGYTTRAVDLQELWRWVGEIPSLSESFLTEAIARGDRCVANFYHDRLVGHGFVARERAPVTDQIDVVVDERLIYRYKGWTDPAHRRRHLSHARGRINWRLFPLRDGMRTVDYVAVHNLASRLKHADVRPVRLGYCGFVRLLGREYPFTGRIPRRFGFRLERRPR